MKEKDVKKLLSLVMKEQDIKKLLFLIKDAEMIVTVIRMMLELA